MSTTTEFPSAIAKARFVRVSPTKARRVINLVRGKSVTEALDILRWSPHAASAPVAKVIASAAANAQNNDGLDPDTLVVASLCADDGPTAKRIRPRAQGRAFRIRRRTSHITVVVESRPRKDERSQSARARRAQASKAAAEKAPTKKASAAKAPAKKAAAEKVPAKKAVAEKVPAKKASAAKAPAKKAAAEKVPAKKAAAEKAPAKKSPAKKASAAKSTETDTTSEAKGGSQ